MVTKQNKYVMSFIIILMLASVIVFEYVILSDQGEASVSSGNLTTASIPTEDAHFKNLEKVKHYIAMKGIPSMRTLDDYYDRRAFLGAPPMIPHPLLSEKGIGEKSCLQCHQDGGYVEQFKAFAPITPHPEFLNCKQCHVSAKTNTLFVSSSFKMNKELNERFHALPGSPPVIPHELQLRDNCLACHGGPSAPKEIRVSHPERVNCRQCHAVSDGEKIVWNRSSKEDSQ